nr:erythrocyte binding protein [Haemonchus contortus]
MDTKSRRLSEDRSGDILNLLRRSSGVESRASTSSPIKLPDHALDGLSQTELEHVMAVLNKSNRSLSPSLSRRNSSALQMLPDMENLSDAERQHIQNVLEKAEHRTPYMISVPLSHQLTARTESFQSSEGISIAVSRNSLDDGYDTQIRNIDDAIRKMEQRAEPGQDVESPPQGSSKPSKTEEVEEALDVTTAATREIEAAKVARSEEIKEAPSPQAVSPSPSAGGFGSLLRKASSALFSATDIWGKESPRVAEDKSPSPSTATPSTTLNMHEIEHIEKVAKLAEQHKDDGRSIYATTVGSLPSSAVETASKPSIESIAKSELSSSSRPETSVGPKSTQDEKHAGAKLTQEELDHIKRVTEMAMQGESLHEARRPVQPKDSAREAPERRDMPAKIRDAGSVSSPSGSLLSTDEQQGLRSISSLSPSSSFMFSVKGFSGFGLQSLKNVIYGGEEAKSPVREGDVGDSFKVPGEQQDAISPESVHTDTSSSKEPVASQRVDLDQTERKPEIAVDTQASPTQKAPKLTKEELDHINRITQMAMEQERKQYEEQPRTPPVTSSIFGAKSLTGFGLKAFKGVMQKAEGARTAIEDLATKQETQPAPSITRAELTQEELDHINKVNQMAAEGGPLQGIQPPSRPSLGQAPKQEELTQEELDHINRITQMAMEGDDRRDVYQLPPTRKQDPVQLSEEELEHINRINEMAAKEEGKHGVDQTPSAMPLPHDQTEPVGVGKKLESAVEQRLSSDSVEQAEERRPSSSMFDANSKTGFGFKAFRGVMQKAEGARTAFEDIAAKKEVHTPPPASQEKPAQLTQEELEHIKKINEMAAMEETWHRPSQPSIVTPPTLHQPEREKEGISRDLKEEEDVRSLPPAFQVEPSQLTQEELDHINRIAQMASDEDRHASSVLHPPVKESKEELPPTPSSSSAHIFDTSSFTGFGMKAFKGVMQKADGARTALEDLAKMKEVSSPSVVPKQELAELTQEELDHINKINEMAEMALQEETRRPSRPPPPAISSEPPELTQEELDHINRVAQMAMEEDIRLGSHESASEESEHTDGADESEYISDEQSTEPQTPEAVEKSQPRSSVFDSSTFSTKSLTGFGLSALKGVMQKAEEARTAFEDKAMKQDDRLPPSFSEEFPSQLTQEELEHIEKINRIAMEEEQRQGIQPQPSASLGGLPELTQEELDHINRIAQMAAEEESKGPAVQTIPISQEQPAQLTQEELDHINRINQMAMELGGPDGRESLPQLQPPSLSKPEEEAPSTSPRSSASLFDTKAFSGFGLKAFKGVMQKAEEAKAAFEGMTEGMEEYVQPPDTDQSEARSGGSTESLTEGEDTVSMGEEAGESMTELDVFDGVEPRKEPQPSSSPPSALSMKSFTGFGFKSFKDVMQKAGEVKDAFGDAASAVSKGPLVQGGGRPSIQSERDDDSSRHTGEATHEAERKLSEEEEQLSGVTERAETSSSTAHSEVDATSRRSSLINAKTFTGFGFKAFKDIMQKAEETKTALEQMTTKKAPMGASRLAGDALSVGNEPQLTQEELDHINRINQMAMEDEFRPQDQLPSVDITGKSSELTQEELDHINRITQMAMEEDAQRDALPSPPVPPAVPAQLTQDEMDHLSRKAQMAMEEVAGREISQATRGRAMHEEQPYGTEGSTGSTEPYIPTSPSVQPSERKVENSTPFTTGTSLFNTKSLTGFGLKAFKGVMQKAEDARTAFEDLGMKQEVRPYPMVAHEKPAELTQEELDHINRINQMAMEQEEREDRQPPPATTGLTQEELDHINRINQMAMEDEEREATRPPQAISPERPTELTQEELDHINRINQMAMEEEDRKATHLPLAVLSESAIELTQEEELDYESRLLEMMKEGQKEEEDVIASVPADELLSSDREQISRGIREDDEKQYEDRLSPVSSTASRQDVQSGMRRRSSGFDVRSIPEMVTKPNLNQWYDEQLSFMKESIADEEEEYRLSEGERERSPVAEDRFAEDVKDKEPEIPALPSPAQAPSVSAIESAEISHESSVSAPSSIVARGRTEAGIDRTSSAAAATGGMLDSSQGGRFRLSGLGKFASGALGKAKQAAAEIAQNVPSTTKLTVGYF